MLRTGRLLNPRLLSVLAGAGHTDRIVVADAGLPLPGGVEVVDLSLVPGTPSLLEVLDAVLEQLAVEGAVVAVETARSPLAGPIRDRLAALQPTEVAHEELKRMTNGARAVVRTGECTPYANVILTAGVTF